MKKPVSSKPKKPKTAKQKRAAKLAAYRQKAKQTGLRGLLKSLLA